MKRPIVTLLLCLAATACGHSSVTADPPRSSGASDPSGSAAASSGAQAEPTPRIAAGPKTVRDFFELLPEKYFVLEGCDRAADPDCRKARAEYLKNFTEVEDVANGYFKGGCDGGQSCIEMAIFKRPDGQYLVGIATFSEMMNEFRFLDYDGGAWTDVSADVVPEFSKRNWYELPRVGTTMKVFENRVVEGGDDFEVTEKGRSLYQLKWSNGKFTKQ